MPCFQEGRFNNLMFPGGTVVAKESFSTLFKFPTTAL